MIFSGWAVFERKEWLVATLALKIAQAAPLMKRAPPRLYDDTERIVCCLADARVAPGRDVTLFASRDWITTVVPVVGRRCASSGCARCNAHPRQGTQDGGSVRDVLHLHIRRSHFPIFRDRAA
jgi:hypothetical protein